MKLQDNTCKFIQEHKTELVIRSCHSSLVSDVLHYLLTPSILLFCIKTTQIYGNKMRQYCIYEGVENVSDKPKRNCRQNFCSTIWSDSEKWTRLKSFHGTYVIIFIRVNFVITGIKNTSEKEYSTMKNITLSHCH